MCGVAGVIGAEADVGAMIAALAHRGPDGARVEHGPNRTLAHARLSIIDLAAGQVATTLPSPPWTNDEFVQITQVGGSIDAENFIGDPVVSLSCSAMMRALFCAVEFRGM